MRSAAVSPRIDRTRRDEAWAGAPRRKGRKRVGRATAIALAGALLAAGCASPRSTAGRRLVYPEDTFAFTNQTHWVYRVDPATGRQTHVKQDSKPDYALHCFVMARATREFLRHVRFDPTVARVDEAEYERLVREVVRRNSRKASPEERKIVFPGYASLLDFSREHSRTLKLACGGVGQSYFQRGNWRMIFPFTRAGQAREARRLSGELQSGGAAIIHAVCFPSLTLNHALVLFEATEDDRAIRFQAYDPNTVGAPLEVTFDKAARRFRLPATHYFIGGPVNVYEVYRGWCY